jgi:hypothetical protein
MLIFKVKCYHGGIWDEKEPKETKAQDEMRAAERVCGGPLIEGGMLGKLRAQVWRPSKPSAKRMFYESPARPK